MTKKECILADINPAQWRDAMNLAMANTDFDGLFHKLFLAMDVSWYTGPESARELALRHFDRLMEVIFDHPPGVAIRDNMAWVASGCLKLELRVYEENFQCIISFVPHTAQGEGFIVR